MMSINGVKQINLPSLHSQTSKSSSKVLLMSSDMINLLSPHEYLRKAGRLFVKESLHYEQDALHQFL